MENEVGVLSYGRESKEMERVCPLSPVPIAEVDVSVLGSPQRSGTISRSRSIGSACHSVIAADEQSHLRPWSTGVCHGFVFADVDELSLTSSQTAKQRS